MSNDHGATYWCDQYHQLEAQSKAKILELEQRVKVLTDAGTSALKYIENLQQQCGVIACSTTGELREALNATPQQTAEQIERGHVEWMMKLPVVATKCDARDERFFFEADIKRMQGLQSGTQLVAIPPLPKESKE